MIAYYYSPPHQSLCTAALNDGLTIPPTITSPPKPVYQTIYTPVNLTCLATGNPIPQIQWFKDGSQLSGRVLPYLYIPELEVQDRGYYHCTATAVYADGRNDTATSERVVVNIDGMSVGTNVNHSVVFLDQVCCSMS